MYVFRWNNKKYCKIVVHVIKTRQVTSVVLSFDTFKTLCRCTRRWLSKKLKPRKRRVHSVIRSVDLAQFVLPESTVLFCFPVPCHLVMFGRQLSCPITLPASDLFRLDKPYTGLGSWSVRMIAVQVATIRKSSEWVAPLYVDTTIKQFSKGLKSRDSQWKSTDKQWEVLIASKLCASATTKEWPSRNPSYSHYIEV